MLSIKRQRLLIATVRGEPAPLGGGGGGEPRCGEPCGDGSCGDESLDAAPAPVSCSYLDLGRAPYVLYGVKYIGLVTLVLFAGGTDEGSTEA